MNSFLSYLCVQCLPVGLNNGEFLKKPALFVKSCVHWGEANRKLVHSYQSFQLQVHSSCFSWFGMEPLHLNYKSFLSDCYVLCLRTTMAFCQIVAFEFWSMVFISYTYLHKRMHTDPLCIHMYICVYLYTKGLQKFHGNAYNEETVHKFQNICTKMNSFLTSFLISFLKNQYVYKIEQ